MQEDRAPNISSPRFDLNTTLFWTKLCLGLVFGFISYMVMRLSDITFFFMIPFLLIIAIGLSFIVLWLFNRRYSLGMPIKKLFWISVGRYTGTYIIAFLALATLSFYWGA